MNNIKGPAIFLAQFVGEDAPFNSLDNICKWVSSLGYKGVQIPSWDARLIDLKKASESKDYCDEIKGVTKKYNLEITELSTHLQGQLVAVHPAYDTAFDGFAAPDNETKGFEFKKRAKSIQNVELWAKNGFPKDLKMSPRGEAGRAKKQPKCDTVIKMKLFSESQ